MKLTPKMLYYDNFTFNISKAAHLIDMGMGRDQLKQFLESKKILDATNRPVQKYLDAGYFEIMDSRQLTDDRLIIGLYSVTYFLPRGIDWLQGVIDGKPI